MNKLSILFLFLLPLNLFGQQWQKTVKFLDSKGSTIKEYPSQVSNLKFKVHAAIKQCQLLFDDASGNQTHTPMISYNMEIQTNGQQVYHWNGANTQSILKINFNKTGEVIVADYQETYRGNSSKIVSFKRLDNEKTSK